MGIYKNDPQFEHCKEAWGSSDEKNWINKFKELRRNDDYFLKSFKRAVSHEAVLFCSTILSLFTIGIFDQPPYGLSVSSTALATVNLPYHCCTLCQNVTRIPNCILQREYKSSRYLSVEEYANVGVTSPVSLTSTLETVSGEYELTLA